MVEHISFSEHLIMAGFNYAYGISAVDITGDGRLDLVAADTDVGLYWFENDGRGNFTRHIIHQRSGEWLERHAVADINKALSDGWLQHRIAHRLPLDEIAQGNEIVEQGECRGAVILKID